MKPSLVVNHLAQYLPRYVNVLTERVKFQSIEAVNGVVTVVTETPHGLKSNAYITVKGMEVKRNIISLVHDGNGYVDVMLDSDHDLTLNWQKTIKIIGANQSEFNGEYPLKDVPNRRSFTYKIANTDAPATGTGDMKLLEYLSYGFDGAYRIVVVNDYQFTFVLKNTELSLSAFNGFIETGQRILAVPYLDHFLKMYEKKPPEKCYVVVVMDDGVSSKDRNIMSDGIGWSDINTDLRQKLFEGFSVFLVYPTKTSIAALEAMDFANEEMRNALVASLFGYKFDLGFKDVTTSGCQFLGHGVTEYNTVWYIHQYRFECGVEFNAQDGIHGDGSADPTRAFRDAVVYLYDENNTELFESDINLDDHPITS